MKLVFLFTVMQGLIATIMEPWMSKMGDLNYKDALNLAHMYIRGTSKKDIMFIIEKAKKAALRHHNASKDDHEEFKRVLHSPNKNRITYIKELIRNPTVQTEQVMEDLSKIVVNGEIWIIKEFINNTNIDLSFGGNRLLELAMEKMNTAMIKLLLTDRRVKNLDQNEMAQDASISTGLESLETDSMEDNKKHNRATGFFVPPTQSTLEEDALLNGFDLRENEPAPLISSVDSTQEVEDDASNQSEDQSGLNLSEISESDLHPDQINKLESLIPTITQNDNEQKGWNIAEISDSDLASKESDLNHDKGIPKEIIVHQQDNKDVSDVTGTEVAHNESDQHRNIPYDVTVEQQDNIDFSEVSQEDLEDVDLNSTHNYERNAQEDGTLAGWITVDSETPIDNHDSTYRKAVYRWPRFSRKTFTQSAPKV